MQDVIHPETGEVLAKNGELITDVQANNIVNAGIEKYISEAYLLVSQKSVFVLNVTVQTLLQVNLLMSVRQLVLLPHSQSVNRVHSLQCVLSTPAVLRQAAILHRVFLVSRNFFEAKTSEGSCYNLRNRR